MNLFRSLAVAVAGLALAATSATAGDRGCSSCGHGFGSGRGGPAAPASTLFGAFHNKPTFQAAPWYNYWPYDAHFLTPAPVSGAFYGPPQTGNFPVNPYFPGPASPYGAAPFGYGPIPGGPPPGGNAVMAPPGFGR